MERGYLRLKHTLIFCIRYSIKLFILTYCGKLNSKMKQLHPRSFTYSSPIGSPCLYMQSMRDSIDIIFSAALSLPFWKSQEMFHAKVKRTRSQASLEVAQGRVQSLLAALRFASAFYKRHPRFPLRRDWIHSDRISAVFHTAKRGFFPVAFF